MNIFEKASLELIDKKILEQVKEYPKRSLYITGPVGVGKTFLAISIAKHVSNNNYKFMLINDFLREFRKCEDAYQEERLMKDLVERRHIILDDLGSEKLTEWGYSILYEFLSKREYYNREALIITSNLSIVELSDKFDTRIASRIIGLCKIIPLEGQDRRLADGL